MNLLFGVMGNNGIPADEKVVRSTATPVQTDAPPAMESDAPQWNETMETDQNPNLGIVNRTVASHWVKGKHYPPFWGPSVDDQYQHNAIVDKQVSTSGTAAQREAAGEYGHGTAKYAIGIEPTGDLREGGKMGNEYFAAERMNVNGMAGDYMSVPPGYDGTYTAQAAQAGKTASRESGNSPYDAWWRGGQ